jgi:methylenetetrahydrofolate dehydrogenase (NADP+) / methenyltetrahydrofolate cyclohydrolase
MLVDGNKIAEDIISSSIFQTNEQKKLCFIVFMDTPESRSFISRKQRMAQKLGVTTDIEVINNVDEDEAIRIIEGICKEFDGVVVQLPLPKVYNINKIVNSVPVERDIDMLSDASQERFLKSETKRVPPVPGAVEEILYRMNFDLVDKNIVILGKGKLVGEPIMTFFRKNDIPFKALDIEDTPDEIAFYLKEADLIISGVGVPNMITPDLIKEGVAIIDAGTSEQAGKLRGDVDPSCLDKAIFLTPVPGGVGPITVAVLYKNLFIE